MSKDRFKCDDEDVDIVVFNVDSIHIERMTKDTIWIGITRGGSDLALGLTAKRSQLGCYVTENDLEEGHENSSR